MKTRIQNVLATLVTLCMVGIGTASACWFSEDNFNGNYIAFVSGDAVHYKPTTLLSQATYYNGMTVDMPFTVYVKVAPRFESSGPRNITIAELQYRVVPNGAWTTVKRLQNVSWEMNFNNPVSLFGKNTINLTDIAAGTKIAIRLYLTDGIYETGDLGTDLDVTTIPETASAGNTDQVNYAGGWSAPFVMYVTYSGKTRPHRN